MKTTIIMPTIHVPKNLDEWAPLLSTGDDIIIAGNDRTPHDEVTAYLDDLADRHQTLHIEYLHPDEELSTRWEHESFLERNHTHRRNLALINALWRGTDLLVTIDDDNYPMQRTWLQGVQNLVNLPNNRQVIKGSEFWNAASMCVPPVIHRGYPVSRWQTYEEVTYEAPNAEEIGVVACLWLGDPDINAMERILKDPVVTGIHQSVTLGADVWCPFDSQSTAIAGKLAPLMFMWTNVGRMDDIWASYLMRAIMDILSVHVTYGRPVVRQDRNPHNLIKDLKDEMLGYEHTEDLCTLLREIRDEANIAGVGLGGDVLELLDYFVTELDIQRPWWLPAQTVDALFAWVADVKWMRRTPR